MVAKGRINARDSPNPKAEVGEIDTRAPFQSVKDAVTMFGEGAFSGERPAIRKPKPHSAERVVAKETQLHLAEKDLNKLKDQLKSAETTKSQALSELEKVKITVEELKKKLRVVTEAKELALKATEAAKIRAKELGEANNNSSADDSSKLDAESARERYVEIIIELDAAKQELRKIRQDRDVSLEAKVGFLKEETEAKGAVRANKERASELSKEIAAAKESIEEVKLASARAQREQGKVFAEQRQSYKSTIEESAKKLELMRKELDPELSKSLESKLVETLTEIGDVEKRIESSKVSDLESVKSVTSELDDAKASLQRVAEEEISLRSLVEAIKLEIETVKREHAELKEKESETESLAGNLHVKLRKAKAELEACLGGETRARNSCDEMISTLNQLSSETEIARKESEETKVRAEELKREAETTKLVMQEAEKKLRIALEEAEEAKSAEQRALDQIKALSDETNAARTSISEAGANITISREEFESLSRKVEESERLAEMKVAAAVAQVEAVRASENEALKRLETAQKEIEEANAAAAEAAKRAEMAEAAKRAVEGELRRWREREQKKAAEAASRILAESEVSVELSPRHYRALPPKPNTVAVAATTTAAARTRKLEKGRSTSSVSSLSTKKALLPNLSGIFNRKKNQIEGGSPSYLPGERPI